MPGFSMVTGKESIVYVDNASFDGTKRTGAMTSDFELWVGSTVAPHVQKRTLSSSDGSVAIAFDGTNLDIKAIGVSEENIFYVGKHGDDSNSGISIEKALLTFSAALTAATGETPSASNRFAIVCLDDGEYTENITCVSFVDIYAPNAQIVGTITAADDVKIKFRSQQVLTGTIGISKTAGTGYFFADIDEVMIDGTGIGLVSTAGFVNFTWKYMSIVDGFGIGDLTSAMGHVHIIGGDIYISGTGTAIIRANAGSTVGRIDHIIDIGGGNGVAINCILGAIDLNISRIQDCATGIVGSGGAINLNVNVITCPAAYNIAAGGELNLHANILSGSETNAGIVRKTMFVSADGTTGTVLTGVTGSDPAFSATPSVTSITIANAPVSTTDGTNKAYVDGIAAGFDWKDTTQAATTAALTVTYDNGVAGVGATLTNAGAQAAFEIDGYTAPVGERVLIKDQSDTFQNGIYVVTDAGSGATNWILTRASDYDTVAEMDEGSLVPVANGTVNQNTLWLQNVSVTTIGVDPITYQKFQNAPFTTTEHATLVGGANDTIASLSLGTANQVLTSNGAGVDPSYQNPFSYRLVQSTTASGAADIQFLNMSANTKYFFDFDLQCTSSAQNIILEYSTDNGSSWVTSGYRSGVHYLSYDSVSMTSFNTTNHCILDQGTSDSRNQQGYFYLSTRGRASVIGQALRVNVGSFGSVRIASDFGSGGSSLNAVRIRAASGNISGFANMYVRIS